jgi:hypothetical protein
MFNASFAITRAETQEWVGTQGNNLGVPEDVNVDKYITRLEGQADNQEQLKKMETDFMLTSHKPSGNSDGLDSKLSGQYQVDVMKKEEMLEQGRSAGISLVRYAAGSMDWIKDAEKGDEDVDITMFPSGVTGAKKLTKEDGGVDLGSVVTCKQSAIPAAKSCVRRLVVEPINKPNIKKQIVVRVAQIARDNSTIQVDLKTGTVLSQHSQKDIPNNLSKVLNLIDGPLTHLSTGHWLVSNDIDVSVLTQPGLSNGYIATLKIVQHNADTNSWRKSKINAARARRDRERGISVTWEVSIKEEPDINEYWEESHCKSLGELNGLSCNLVDRQPMEENVTKQIHGIKEPITRPYWSEQLYYTCEAVDILNECDLLINQGCEQISSSVSKEQNSIPLEYINTFRCGATGYSKPLLDDDLSFVGNHETGPLDGYGARAFSEAAVALNILEEIKPELANGADEQNNISTFKGEPQFCKITGGRSIRDCCNLKGIFKDGMLIFNGCEESEKLATASVKEKRCHMVAKRYCSKHLRVVFGKVCIEWKDSFCCFGSELAKLIHEIARDDVDQQDLRIYNKQMGVHFNWGIDDHPNCNALSVDQLSKINFDTPFAKRHLGKFAKDKQESLSVLMSHNFEKNSLESNVEAKIMSTEESMTRNRHLRDAKYGKFIDQRQFVEQSDV